MIQPPATNPADHISYSQFGSVHLAQDVENTPENLRKAAQQFESIFLGMWLKSAREATAVLAEDSPFRSSQIDMFSEMHDHEMAVEISRQGGLGLTDIIVAQLGGEMTPVSSAPADGLPPMQSINRPDNSLKRVPFASPAVALAAPVGVSNSEQAGEHKPMFESPAAFVKDLYQRFKDTVGAAGLPVEAVLGQSALETGWGKHMITSPDGTPAFNLFGIKATSPDEPAVVIETSEFENGRWLQRLEAFRQYGSFEQSLEDYVNKIKDTDRYSQAAQAAEAEDYVSALQAGGYATDPAYAQKVMDVVAKVRELLR